MKELQKITFLFFLLLISCKNDKPDLSFDKEHEKMHQEDEKISEAFTNFENLLNKLYVESEKNPDKVLRKVDSLLLVNKMKKTNTYHKLNLTLTIVYIVLKQSCFILLANTRNLSMN